MTDQTKTPTDVANFLANIEHDEGLLHILASLDFSRAIDELRGAGEVFDTIVKLGDWAIHYPNATGALLRKVADDPVMSRELAPAILGCDIVNGGQLSDEADEILSAAFSQLKSPWRDAAADREGVRQLLGIKEGDGYEAVAPPDPGWQWPAGQRFPASDTVEGAQARLNYLGLGCGPVNGEWNEPTRRAVVRWQIQRGLPPTGDLDDATIFQLARGTPDAPE